MPLDQLENETAPTFIVRDCGFTTDTWTGKIVHLNADSDPSTLHQLVDCQAMIVVTFDSFADGRGFTIARHLRAAGFTGRLRASGDLIADQYAMARRSGFDEVEITHAKGLRQPQEQWLARANWQSHDYQAHLRGSP